MSPLFAADGKLIAVATLLIAGGLFSLCPLSGECPLVRMIGRRAETKPVGRPEASAATPAPESPGETASTAPHDPPAGGGETMSTLESKPASIGRVLHADLESFEQVVLKSEVPVLVDFYADWCRPCQMLAPTLEELAREMPDAKIVKVNVDESPQLAGHFGISSIPAVMVFKDGNVVASRLGLADKASLKQLLGS